MPHLTTPEKPRKPRPDFPLFPHATGQWAKKVRGRLHYFGKWSDDPKGKAALQRWLDQKDDLLAGREPRAKATIEGPTVADVCNSYLTYKKGLLEAREITPRTFQEYHAVCERLVKVFGRSRLVTDLVADDFQRLRQIVAKTWGPIRLANEVQRTRSVFKHGYEVGLITLPVRFGPGFKKPSAKVLRQNRTAAGLRMFEREELLAILNGATTETRAVVLLALNAGLGNGDIAALPIKALNLKSGWLDYPRAKTGVPRHCPLWPETIAAIKAMPAERRPPKNPEHEGLLFLNERRNAYGTTAKGMRPHQGIGRLFDRTVTKAGIKRPGTTFYSIRRTFQTIAEGAHDSTAIAAIMGHTPHVNDMSAIYRQRIDDARLLAVVEHVRHWLFSESPEK
ncbi:MAG: tyrosine-type recombinase/integrase [Planctomycetes bacterium]|nr:tyrosine-type recombinase/integrase [Planctomycetota bacterium]MBU4400394.1 tyrosine-type recombinase/integrase [Planctomycetota bacterium]MCG2682586.1 tyrosine-type recombinase/integrase [Planctomycetales bacterium]